MNANVSYAGFWKRFVAYILDQLILGFARLIIFVPLWLFILAGFFIDHDFEKFENYTNTSAQHFHSLPISLITTIIFIALIFGLINIIAEWLYYAMMESSKKQATLGKMIMGIKVTDLYGQKISFGKATGRYFGKILSGLILGIGYIMVAFTEKKQALHDILSNCVVVDSISFPIPDMNA